MAEAIQKFKDPKCREHDVDIEVIALNDYNKGYTFICPVCEKEGKKCEWIKAHY